MDYEGTVPRRFSRPILPQQRLHAHRRYRLRQDKDVRRQLRLLGTNLASSCRSSLRIRTRRPSRRSPSCKASYRALPQTRANPVRQRAAASCSDKLTVEEMPASGRRYPWVGFKADREPGKDRLFVTEVSKTVDGVKLLNNISFIVGKEDKIAILGKTSLPLRCCSRSSWARRSPIPVRSKWGASTTQAYFPGGSQQLL